MKILKTYIEQTNDPIRQQMIRFLKSEVLLDRNIFNETLDLENDCLYKGQRELAIYVAEKILKEKSPYLVFYKNDLKDFENIFFEKLEIEYSTKDSGFRSKVKFDNETKSFKTVEIVLNTEENKYEFFKHNVKTLIHELDHAYRDLESYIKNEKFHLYDFAKPGTKYYKCIQWSNIAAKDYTKRIIYYFEEFEKSAYLSEIKNDLEGLSYNDYKELIDLAEQHSEAYQLYNNLLVSFVELVKHKKLTIRNNTVTLDEFCKEYNELTEENLSNKEIIEHVIENLSQTIKFMNKLLLSIYNKKNKVIENDMFRISCLVEKYNHPKESQLIEQFVRELR